MNFPPLILFPLQFDPENEADRLLLVNGIIHAADIGNAVRPFEINDAMSKRVHREFQVLAEEEGRLGIPVTFAIDSSNPLMCAQVCLPLSEMTVTT